MDGENNGKPYFLVDDLGGKTHYFRKHPYFAKKLDSSVTRSIQNSLHCGLNEIWWSAPPMEGCLMANDHSRERGAQENISIVRYQ